MLRHSFCGMQSYKLVRSSLLCSPVYIVATAQYNNVTKINLLHFNARSLLPKLDNLKLECIEFNPHIVCISETWLDSTITDNELTIDNYNPVRLDRSRHGGGIAIYVHVDFTYHVILLVIVIVILNVLFCLSQLIYVNFVFVCCTDLPTVILMY